MGCSSVHKFVGMNTAVGPYRNISLNSSRAITLKYCHCNLRPTSAFLNAQVMLWNNVTV